MDRPTFWAVVQGVGMHTSLGGVVEAAAAQRCNLARPEELIDAPYFDEDSGEARCAYGHPSLTGRQGFKGTGRILRMTAAAIDDLGPIWAGLDPARLAVFVVWPTLGPNDPTADALHARLGRILQQRTGLDPAMLRLIPQGPSGVALALRHAHQLLQGGTVDRVLLSVADSLLDVARLRKLLEEGRLHTQNTPAGLMPGEAACTVLLRRPDMLRNAGAGDIVGMLALPGAVVDAAEAHDQLDRAFAQAVGVVLQRQGHPPEAPLSIYSDFNGEYARAKLLGSALMRLRQTYAVDQWELVHPAQSFGDTGAAALLLAATCALRACARGYLHGETALAVAACGPQSWIVLAVQRRRIPLR